VLDLRALPALADNYIWTLADSDGRGLIVDPGEAAPVLAAMAEGFRPLAVLLTHHHGDHIGGTGELLAACDMPVFAPHDERIPWASHRVADGDRLTIPGLDWSFDVIAVPGHTRSHVAFCGQGLLFCGDTLFSLGCGRLFEGTPAQMLASLDRLAALPDATLVCCGHEYTEANGRFARAVEPVNPTRDARLDEVASLRRQGRPSLPSTLGSERACNPFLRSDFPGIRDSLAAQRGLNASDRAQAFAALREWKNGFRA
jgi:hydroxyacylglutathione hydrolase